ncbi:sensor histidine kinase [Aeromicrobium wangtongii]|uniref:Sensor-like histidine kinase SenX3 n=1 Tax=Aeromicrobium wangtongii TaxID=2969247 RepID=A0ABY5MBP7_9ACTN|nr:GAF domain-containing sensor histidine kinase [Aeromicrobium wangtongii]MCD9196646.1 GAF domain-containing sensor histidine kinase [Aeromicrobium wangtongii]UUP14157.1 GAF domain-containing sensor histidine kinase [Aeromicrobium wangtongii]
MESSVRDAAVVDREIERYGRLDPDDPGRDLQSLVDLVAAICEAPYAAIAMVGSERHHQIASFGFDISSCSCDQSMCGAILDDPGTVVVPDTALDPRFSGNPHMTGADGSVRFHASAPVLSPGGVPLGRLAVLDTVPRELTDVQTKALSIMAGQVTVLLDLRYRGRALEDSLQELMDVRDELKRSNSHLSQFAGQVSHDLRAPLTAILLNAELLAMEPVVEENTEVAQMVDALSAAGHRMDSMIEEMLAFAQEDGRLRLVETDLTKIVELVLTDVDPMIRREDADIRVGPLPHVTADPALLYPVVLNLVTNAIKFARPGTRPIVSITSERLTEHWRIRVTDNGIGVPADRHEAVFELFTRVPSATAGHGIGLATARRIISAHGGASGMENAPGGGTSVWFDLPV